MNKPQALNGPFMRYLWVLTFVLAAALWSVQTERPVDLPNWHEFDYSSIARNFVREGNNILYPRIDWRGDGPGFTEMEFPIIPWTMSGLYHVLGTHEWIGRVMSYGFMLLALAVFSRLALRVLPEGAAIVAALFFVVAHVVTLTATAIQPEALMLLLYLLAVFFFVDWYERGSWVTYAAAIASFSCAMLVKSPAAHLAIFFFIWALSKDGVKAFKRPSLYLFAVLSFTPVVAWYAHAASLWHQFHNSMGVSNEDHWIGMDILRRPKVMANFVSIDLLLVAGLGGAMVAAAVLLKDRLKTAVNRLACYWLAAIAVYLVVIIRTAGAYWAAYYHVIAVPPLALLFAAGAAYLQRRGAPPWRSLALWSGLAGAILLPLILLLGKRDLTRLPGVFQDLVAAQSSIAVLLVLAVLAFGVTVLCSLLAAAVTSAEQKLVTPSPLTPMVIAGVFIYFFLSGQMLLGTWKTWGKRTPQFQSAVCLKDKLVPGTLIVASGGICQDAGGHRVANDAPNMFYWLDHKGFTTCQGHESAAELRSMARLGARYFIADKSSFSDEPGFETELRNSFPVVADCDSVLLFALQSQ